MHCSILITVQGFTAQYKDEVLKTRQHKKKLEK